MVTDLYALADSLHESDKSDLGASDHESELSVSCNNDHDTRAETWFFDVILRLTHGQNFSDFLNTRKEELETCLASSASESVISWACSQSQSETSGTFRFDGFVHDGSSNQIRLTSLQRLLPEGKMTGAGEVIRTVFEEVHPGRGKNYMDCPKIRTFLQESSLDPLAGRRLRVDYRGSTDVCFKEIMARTWFWHGSMRCSDSAQVEAIFRSENMADRQKRKFSTASVISFACSGSVPTEADPGTLEVDLLVHSSRNIRLRTLEEWLNTATVPEIVKDKWECIETGKGKGYMDHTTVKTFLQVTTKDQPTTGKRLRIDLVGASDEAPRKRGRQAGWRKPRPADTAEELGGRRGGGACGGRRTSHPKMRSLYGDNLARQWNLDSPRCADAAAAFPIEGTLPRWQEGILSQAPRQLSGLVATPEARRGCRCRPSACSRPLLRLPRFRDAGTATPRSSATLTPRTTTQIGKGALVGHLANGAMVAHRA